MAAAVCNFCSHANPDASNFCTECGASLQLKLCHGCEAINHRTALYCHKCGTELPNPSSIVATTNDLPCDESVRPLASTIISSLASSATDDAATAPRTKATLPRRSKVALVALPLIALAAGVYYAYHVGAPASSSLRNSSDVSEAPRGIGARNVNGSEERAAGSKTRSTDPANALTALPSVPSPDDGLARSPVAEGSNLGAISDEKSLQPQPPDTQSAPAADAPAKSAPDGPPQRPEDRDVGRDGSGTAPKPAAGMLIAPAPRPPTQDISATFQPPNVCTDAVAALGLCNRNKLDEGK